MDRNVRKCQESETYDECITRKYIQDVQQSCLPKCTGLQIPSYDEDSIERFTELRQSLDDFNSKLLSVVNGKSLKAEHVILPPSFQRPFQYG